MKILMVSSFLPFPLFSGGHIRLYNLIKNLSNNDHEITLICEKRQFQTQEDINEVEKICKKVIVVGRLKQWSVSNILKTGISKDPFLVVGHTNNQLKLAIQDELVREKYDIIHVETFYVYQNLPAGKVGLPKVSIPVVLVEHNIEYLVYERYAKLANPFLKPFFYLDILKLKKIEQQAWERADKLVAVSNADKKIIKRADTFIVPNGVDTDSFLFRSFQHVPQEKRILFIGDFKWIQNQDALEFILKEVWPNILAKLSTLSKDIDLKLWIVGKNIPEDLKNLAKAKNIILDEKNNQETSLIFRQSYILLAPLRVAGGTSYKILEAFASGTAVVTTDLGIVGLEAKDKTHVLSGETPFELADLVCNLLMDHSLYKRITLNARKFVEDKYDWKKITKKLEEVYISCL
nr:glycosyltransferase family 4 protein [Candidatus Levybacteria bacterium]